MAPSGNSSNTSSSEEKTSPPPPSPSSNASESQRSSPSKSPPSSSDESSSVSDSDGQSQSKSQSSSSTPSPSDSPEPSPTPSPPPSPPPPSPSKSPPPSPPPPPPTSPPPPPPKVSPPPPSPTTPPPTQPSSPPPASPPPPRAPNITAPPPPTPPPPSPVTPPSPPVPPTSSTPNRPLAPSQPQPVPAAPHSRASGAPPRAHSPSSSPNSRGSGDKTGQHAGIALAAIFIVALIALVLFLVLRKKKSRRGDPFLAPPPNGFHFKGGGDVHYYVEQPGVPTGSQNSHSTHPRPYGNVNQAAGGNAIRHVRTLSEPTGQQQQMSGGPIAFNYDKIVEITNGLSGENVIGQGGFGFVYKASMPDGRVGAVKLLKAGSGQGEREFRAEVDIISRVHHRHLVSLIGYCVSEEQRVLIYEFVPNGNLNHHLHGSGVPVLDWPKRMKIANGAARGLAYLHEGCNPKIIHRDIKSANILLDDAYEAQVADFGLARLTDDVNTHVSTRVMGTFGYMAPEYATSGKLTDRSDVFSFGVVLLELISGRKPVDTTQPVGEESLVEWARPLLLHAVESRGDFGELVDPRLEGNYVHTEMFRMVEAAAACVRHSAPKRPRMGQIARALEIGDQICDLSNGVKYGQSTVYDSGQYNDISRFRRMANGSFSDSDFDLYSTEYSPRGTSSWMTSGSSVYQDSRAFPSHGSAEPRP